MTEYLFNVDDLWNDPLSQADVFENIIYLLDLSSIQNLIILCQNWYKFITNLPIYEKLKSISGKKQILENGDLKIIKLLYNNTNIKNISINDVKILFNYGHGNVIKWIQNNGYCFDDISKLWKEMIINASKKGYTSILEWFKNNNYKFGYITLLIINACRYGNLNVLEFYKQNGQVPLTGNLLLTYKSGINYSKYVFELGSMKNLRPNNFEPSVYNDESVCAINEACENGHSNVLEWFKNSGLDYNYNEYSIGYACKNGHINILEWFKNNESQFKYDEYAINVASANGHVHILDWFKNNNIKLKYDKDAIIYASKNGHVHILDWCGLKFKYDKKAIDQAYVNGHINVLDWFKNSKFKFKYSHNSVDFASSKGNIDVLDWFKRSNYMFKYSKHAIDMASANGHINILDW